ncbi:MAG: ATP-binding protein, partial [Bacteroidota bacterium]
KRVVETGTAAQFEQFYEADGLSFWFDISAVKIADGFTVTFQDITALKESYLRMEQSEKRYRKLFEESLDPILLVHRSGLIEKANEAAQHAFGFKSNAPKVGLKVLFNDESLYHSLLADLEGKGNVEELELEMKGPGKKTKHCIVNGVQLYDQSGENLTGFQLVIRDLTKRKAAEKELVLAEKLSMSGKIARTIAHEIRNPLTNLTLALEQLKDEIPEEVEDADLYFSIISRNAERINNLISELLDSSKPKDLKLIPQSLNSVVEEALALVIDRTKLRGITLVKKLSSHLPEIAVDADQLKVAILNLLVNAVEAVKAESGRLVISTSTNERYTELQVSDNGKGIPPEELDNLFEPFYTAKKGGMGLGLTAVQNIVQSHNATISVSSEQGKGTRFIITFRNTL